jgi:hypothetical protein
MDRRSTNWEVYLDMITMCAVLLGAACIGVASVGGVQPLEYLGEIGGGLLGTFIGMSAVYLVLRRDTYLPFLGKSAYPCGSLSEKSPLNANTTARVRTAPNTNVIYWAAESGKSDVVVDNPWDAYDQYANTGVARSDANGYAVLRFRKPAQYRTPGAFPRTLPVHVHYRICKGGGGMLGRVETLAVE